MSKAQLAFIGLLGALNAALVISGITYCCVPRSKNTEEKTTENFDGLKITPQSLESENCINKNQKKEVIKNDTSKTLIAPPPKGISNVTGIYIKDGREIELCQQQKLDCWGYAAAFMACLKGKGNKVTLEEGKFNGMAKDAAAAKGIESKSKKDYQDEQVIMEFLRLSGIPGEDCTLVQQMCPNEDVLGNEIGKLLDSNRVLAIWQRGHWITICEKKGKGFWAYDSLRGKMKIVSQKELFEKLVRYTDEFGTKSHIVLHGVAVKL